MWFIIAIIVALLGLIVWATTRKSRFGHWARNAVTILSGGFAFPHSFTEDDDAKREADKGTKVKAQ
jgi:hypothetical protein